MSRKYKFQNQNELYFVTFSVIGWIDLFIRDEYKKIMLDSWRYCMQHKGMDLYGWVIMTSHIHMIIGSHLEKLERIMQHMKQYTSAQLKKAIRSHDGESRREWMLKLMTEAGLKNCNNQNFQLWQQHNHPIELFTAGIAHQKLDYIHYNPVIAGFVDKPEDYLYSSARDYCGGKGLIEIDLLEPMIVSR